MPQPPSESVGLFFTSPPYADARAYSRIHPDRYVEWFLPFARSMFDTAKPSGSLILNIKNRVANKGPLKGQRHPCVYHLVLALQHMGWRWIETYIWAKPNAVLGKFGPRTKDSLDYVHHLARGAKPFFDVQAVRVAYKADEAGIKRRTRDVLRRRSTKAGLGRDRTKTYPLGGADPGNVVNVPQTYNQHRGVAHNRPSTVGADPPAPKSDPVATCPTIESPHQGPTTNQTSPRAGIPKPLEVITDAGTVATLCFVSNHIQ